MNLNDYQRAAARTMGFDDKSMRHPEALACWALGVAGEAGEVADYLKKVLFHGHDLDTDKLVKEMGDVLWYLAVLARQCGVDLEDVAAANIEKLKRRYPGGFSNAASRAREPEVSA